MKIKKLTLISGGRDEIEQNLVRAIFLNDMAEYERLSQALTCLHNTQPTLSIVHVPKSPDMT